MTQEFHICVTPVSQDNYLVQTQQVAPGVPVAHNLVKLPVADWLTQLNTVWQSDCILPLSESPTNSSLAGDLLNLVTLGQQFYAALFQGSLQDSWSTAQQIAQQRQEVLRLRLGLKETRLNSLPWEILHTGDRFLVTDPAVTFSRYQADATLLAQEWEENIAPTLPLPLDVVRVLIVIATPTEQASLALKQEAIRLQVESQLQSSGSGTTELEFTLLEHPSREQLLQALEQEEHQILHYVGQSNLSASRKEPYLIFGKTHCVERLNADELASLLAKHDIQMVVFNFCRPADTENLALTADILEVELIQRLAKHGIKSVLTLGNFLPVEVTLRLMGKFYYNIIQGYYIDFSLSRIREELICAYGFDQLYWARPILYLQPECDGYLTTSEFSDLVVSDNDFNDTEEVWEDLADVEDDDPTYQEDSAVVADLFSQLANPTVSSESGEEDEDKQNLEEPSLIRSQSPLPLVSSKPPPALPSKGYVPRERTSAPIKVVLGVVGSSAIALVGLWWQQRLPLLENFLPPIYQSLLAKPFEIKLKITSSSSLTVSAIEKFKQADFSGGYLVVEELLNRGELQSASIAIGSVSQQQAGTSEINFLRGRLAWQSVQLGYKNYSLEDACRYWEAAVKYKPDSPLYYNALGFAYHAAGNLERANQTWFQALYLVKEQQAAKTTDSSLLANTTFNADQIALNAYAGLAMVINKAALNQPSDKQADLLSEAIKLRQKVLKDDPVKFQPQNLSKNWLWTKQAIQDWRSLLQQRSEE